MSEQFLHGIEVISVLDGSKPVQTVRSSVIGLVGTAGKGPVNEPVLIIGNKRDAVAKFGEFRNDGFTIPAALDAIFQQVGAMVVVVNVLDPALEDNQATVTEEAARLAGSIATLLGGHLTADALTFTTGTSPARTVFALTQQPTNGQQVVVGTKTWTYKTALSSGPAVANEVLIGATLADSRANLIAAANGATGEGTTYSTGTVASTQVTALPGPTGKVYFTASTPGAGGNSIATTTTVTGATFTGATLAGGATGTLINAPYVLAEDGVITLPGGATLVRVEDADGDEISFGDLTLGTKVTVYYVATLAEGTDFSVQREEGTITRPPTGSKLLSNSGFVVTYQKTSGAAIDGTDIIGGAESDGTLSGAQCLLDARSKVFVQPRIICAPGFTHQKEDAVTRNVVAAAFEALSDRLRATVVFDTPSLSREAAVAYRNDFGGDRHFVAYPFVRVAVPNSNGTILSFPSSAHVAGRISATDNAPEKGFWWSPSNQPINGIVGLDKPVDFSVGDKNTTANYLNENNVVTIVYQDGFRLWGNRAAAGNFLCVKRTDDIIGDSIVAAHLWALDRPITRGYLAAVVGAVNEYMRRLVQQGAILGGTAWADPALNTEAVVSNGELFIDYDWTPVYPAEHIRFRAHIVNDYISEIFAL